MPRLGGRQFRRSKRVGLTERAAMVAYARRPDVRIEMTEMAPVLGREVPEDVFLMQIINYAAARGWRGYHTYDSRISEPGFPDLVLVRPPRILVVETKQNGEYPSAEQRLWLGDFRACPAVETYVFRPKDWPEIVSTLA